MTPLEKVLAEYKQEPMEPSKEELLLEHITEQNAIINNLRIRNAALEIDNKNLHIIINDAGNKMRKALNLTKNR